MISQDRPNPAAPSPVAAGPDTADTGDERRIGATEQDDQAELPFDYIDEALEETMPASDPPAFNPGTGIGPPGRHKDKERRDQR